MKNLFLLFSLLLVITKVNSQTTAQPMTGVFCFGNEEHKFISNLSSDAKIEFDKILKKYSIDTSYLYRVKYDEVFSKYGLVEYLSNHTYTYVNWYKSFDKIKYHEKISLNGSAPSKANKIILLYTTTDNAESLSLYMTN